ncbi:immediate early response gene 5-like protein [Oncorhynchus keta]|uniref:immediate early response gene 5-like protein n=1 Tax=Oncorhynchus keta TaxID=8018 RepID=UPI00227C31A1|nr:immediate early response gene 5-like protein [Oncorhynchus keta]
MMEECAIDAQNIISISLQKIHNSRTQRGGIKLHKNLLVTYVLANARDFYMSVEFAGMYSIQQNGEMRTVSDEKQDSFELTGNCDDRAGEFCCNYSGDSLDTYHCAAPQSAGYPAMVPEAHTQTVPACPMAPVRHCDFNPAMVPEAHTQTVIACPMAPVRHCDSNLLHSEINWDYYSEPYTFKRDILISNTPNNQKTVLDLDTHVVTTVDYGYLHADYCLSFKQHGQCLQGSPKKRKIDSSYVSDSDYLSDFLPMSCKQIRSEDVYCCNSEQLDTNNISNLMSVLDSGFNELLTWQTDLEQVGLVNGQTNCCKQALACSGAWTRAIEAF